MKTKLLDKPRPLNGTPVSDRDYKAYERKMELVRGNLADAKEKTAAAWWALYEIDRDELYAKAHGYSKTEWVKELATHEGISHGKFYRVMKLILAFKKQRLADETIREILGEQLYALESDLAQAFDKAGNLLPEAKAKIDEEYGSFGKMVQSVRGVDPGQARAMVTGLFSADKIFVLDDAVVYNPQRGELLVNVRWDGEGGLVGIYTVRLTVTQVAEGVECKDPKYLPEKLAGWLGGRFGVKV